MHPPRLFTNTVITMQAVWRITQWSQVTQVIWQTTASPQSGSLLLVSFKCVTSKNVHKPYLTSISLRNVAKFAKTENTWYLAVYYFKLCTRNWSSSRNGAQHKCILSCSAYGTTRVTQHHIVFCCVKFARFFRVNNASRRLGNCRMYTAGGSVAEWLACRRARVQIAVSTLSDNSLRQTVRTHRASVHQAAKLVAALLRVAGVTAVRATFTFLHRWNAAAFTYSYSVAFRLDISNNFFATVCKLLFNIGLYI